MPTKPGHLTTEQARERAGQRKTYGGNTAPHGHPRKLSPCKWGCGAILSATEHRTHGRTCARKP